MPRPTSSGETYLGLAVRAAAMPGRCCPSPGSGRPEAHCRGQRESPFLVQVTHPLRTGVHPRNPAVCLFVTHPSTPGKHNGAPSSGQVTTTPVLTENYRDA